MNINYSHIIDISLPLNKSTIIYPSNPSVEIETLKSASKNLLSKITFGSHTGTHIDAPRHISESSMSIDQIPLKIFIGSCRVIDCTDSNMSISAEDLRQKNIQKGERILLKTTNSNRGFQSFYEDYIFVSSEAAAYLSNLQVSLVGIDYLSIKQKGSPDNTPHTHLLNKNIPIIEGIDLSKVSEGEYILIALPLRFTGIDGSPARVVLLK